MLNLNLKPFGQRKGPLIASRLRLRKSLFPNFEGSSGSLKCSPDIGHELF